MHTSAFALRLPKQMRAAKRSDYSTNQRCENDPIVSGKSAERHAGAMDTTCATLAQGQRSTPWRKDQAVWSTTTSSDAPSLRCVERLICYRPSGRRAISKLTAVGFEPTQLALVELESTPLDHSGKLSLLRVELAAGPLCISALRTAP